MQREAVLNNAQTAKPRSYRHKDSQSQKDKRDYLAALLLWSTYSDMMRKALAPILYALLIETGKDAMGQVNLDPSMFNTTALPILNYSQQQAQRIADDVDAETEKQLRASVGQGVDNNESDDELRARIELIFGAALTYRAARIAKTETTRAQGFADIEAWKQSGVVTGKEWTVQSGNPCKYCDSMDGVIVSLDQNYFSLGDVLTVDGQSLNIDYDNIASPPVHVNCQCILLPITTAV